MVLLAQLVVNAQATQRITSFEEALKELESAKLLDLVCSDIPEITAQITKLQKLESLYLTGCGIDALPEGIG